MKYLNYKCRPANREDASLIADVIALAFGDGGNDVSMLRAAGIGIAMGGASDLVKSSADYITDDVDDDGIYNTLVYFGVINQRN